MFYVYGQLKGENSKRISGDYGCVYRNKADRGLVVVRDAALAVRLLGFSN